MFSGILRTPSTNKNPFTGEGGFLCHLSALWRFFIYWCPHPLQWWEERVIRTNVNTGLIAQVGESYRHTTRNILTNARESVKYTDWFERTHSDQEKSRETIHSINIHQSKLPIRRQTSRVGSDFNTLHKLESLQIIAPCTSWADSLSGVSPIMVTNAAPVSACHLLLSDSLDQKIPSDTWHLILRHNYYSPRK